MNEVISKLESTIKKYEHEIEANKELHSNELWCANDIAEYLKFSYKYTTEFIISHPSFPNAIRVSTTKSDKKCRPRWYVKDVKVWVAKHKSKH